MARGWESKSIEAQIELAESNRSARKQKEESPRNLAVIRERESLLLSRTRVERELGTAQNSRYAEILRKALTDLDARLSLLTVK